MSGHLDLIIGKPNLGADEKIATFTRFVLPFAFQLQPIEHEPNQADLFYTLNDKTDLSFIKRRKYFTRETSDALYEQRQWLSICAAWNQTSWGKAEVTVNLRDKPFKIAMLPLRSFSLKHRKLKSGKKRISFKPGFFTSTSIFLNNQV